jgi:hypothetical protein
MDEVRVHFRTTTYWVADMDWSELRRLAAEQQWPDDGDFRCPATQEVSAVSRYEIQAGHEPCSALAEELQALGAEIDTASVAITELESGLR